MEVTTPKDFIVFIQPGGLDPDAENLEWLTQTPETLKLPADDPDRRAQGRIYYERLSRNNNADWVRRYVHAQYGDDPSGTAVFRESFKIGRHVTPEGEHLNATPTYPLVIGQDFGRDPCSVICQLNHKGQLLVLEEVLAEDIGLEIHLQRSLRPALMQERYLGHPVVIIGDPAGNQRSSIYEENTFDVLKRMGWMAYPAPTNDIDKRIRAIEAFMMQQDGLLIDRDRCPKIVRALSGGYRFGKTRGGQRRPVPDKNEYSHIIDALQYAALAAHGGLVGYITSRVSRPVARRERVRSAAGWT